MDEYGIQTMPEQADSDGMLPPLTTSAQAEGAIDGEYTDYYVAGAWTVDFKFSQYNRIGVVPSKAATKRVASTAEWDGKNWIGTYRGE